MKKLILGALISLAVSVHARILYCQDDPATDDFSQIAHYDSGKVFYKNIWYHAALEKSEDRSGHPGVWLTFYQNNWKWSRFCREASENL